MKLDIYGSLSSKPLVCANCGKKMSKGDIRDNYQAGLHVNDQVVCSVQCQENLTFDIERLKKEING